MKTDIAVLQTTHVLEHRRLKTFEVVERGKRKKEI